MASIHPALDGYTLPASVIATRDPSGLVHIGADRDPSHPMWTVRTADPSKIRGADVEIDLDPVIGAGGARATRGDAATMRIVAIEALRNQYFGSLSAATMPHRLRNLFWIMRWRHDLGITSMSDLTPVLFEDFCRRLRGGQVALVDMNVRLAFLAGRIETLGWSLYCRATPAGTEIDFGSMATDLGLSRTALVNSDAYATILRMVADHDPGLYKRSVGGDIHAVLADLTDRAPPAIIHPEKALLPWRWLHDLSIVGALSHDQLGFDPFERITFTARVRTISASATPRSGRTDTPPAEHWLTLLDHAARWVLDWAGPIMAVTDAAAEVHRDLATAVVTPSRTGRGRRYVPRQNQAEYRARVQAVIVELGPKGKGAPVLLPWWCSTSEERAGDGRVMNLEQALAHLAAACLVLIGGLSARRSGEIQSLRAGCTEQDPFGNWWLSAYIEKTIRDIDRIPVPSSVAHAVHVLERLSLSARETNGEAWIGRIHRPTALATVTDNNAVARAYLKTRFDRALNDFWTMVGAPDAGVWSFKPHQLRRAFSIYYYHGNRFSSLDALSRFLRHFDPEMTRRYITEGIPGALMRLREIVVAKGAMHEARADARAAANSLRALAADHEDVRRDAYVERMAEVYDGAENPIGMGALTIRGDLEALVEMARIRVRISGQSNGSPDREREALIDQLRALAPFRRLDPHPGRHVHCNLVPGDKESATQAVCQSNRLRDTGRSIDAGGPDYAHCSIGDCLSCRFGVAFDENVASIRAAADRMAASAERAPSHGGREAARLKLAALKDGLRSAKNAARPGGR
jgi:integrase